MDPNRKIRVAVDARPLSSPMAGVSRVIANILKFFPDKDRFEFHLYSHRGWHSDFDFVVNLPNVIWVQGRGIAARKGGIWFNLSLPTILHKGAIDVFWGSQQVIPPFLPSRIKVVLTYYDLVMYLFPESMRPVARYQQLMVQKMSVQNADRILTISDQTRIDLIKRFQLDPRRVSVALLGYEEPANAKGEKRRRELDELLPFKEPYILAVSTVEPRKNYRVLLEAYMEYMKSENQGKPYRLVIAGRRGWESEGFYKRMDEIIAGTGTVHLLEGVSDEELKLLYDSAAFFVMPSIYEGFGLPLLEALASGKCAIVSDIGPFREIGGEHIEYVPSLDISRWKDALMHNISLHRSGKLKLTDFSIKEWTWDRTSRLHQEAFVAVVE